MKKLFPYAITLAAVLCASLFLSCYSELELPLSPEEKFSSSVLKSSSSVPKSSAGASSSSSAANEFTDDRDNKPYKLVKIGTHTWMAENLNYNAAGSKCYDSKSANCDKYGRLYNWATAKDACPDGWHLPIKEEWETLITKAGGASTAGKNLKTEALGGTDAHGFAAQLGGFGNSEDDFAMAGKVGIWWTDSNYSNAEAYNLYMYNGNDEDEDKAQLNHDFKSDLYSVRCVKD